MSAGAEPTPLDVLRDARSTLAATLQAVEAVEAEGARWPVASVGIAANVTVPLLGTFLRKHALLNRVRVAVQGGNHDDLLGDLDRFVAGGVQHAVVVEVFDNLRPAFEAQVQHLPDAALEDAREVVRQRFRLAFTRARSLTTVFVARFHRLSPVTDAGDDRVGRVIAAFNAALEEEAAAFPNVRLIDSDDVVRTVGMAAAVDRRFYFRGKAPYTTAFLGELARRIVVASRAFGTVFPKAVVLDCDNALWGGIVGEDLLDGIRLDPHDYPGNVFWRVQQELLALQRAGILLCLCSKNNAADVDEVLHRHPHMVLRDEHLILKKVNWADKVDNLREIAATLDIGLDALIFLDDSDFECSTVRARLPEVRTFQVPGALPDYPVLLAEIRALCLGGGVTAESRGKTEQYRQRAQAEEARAGFASPEAFLASLGMRVEIARDRVASAPRISELTQKSNQFNVTTRRYAPGEIAALMAAPDATVYSLVVEDRFGSAGLTGVLIMRWEGAVASVDSFLMSCRVLGRGIEQCVWHAVVADARQRGCAVIRAEYLRTARNAQVEDFFDRLGLACVAQGDGGRRYEAPIDAVAPQPSPWIEVVHGS